MHHGEGLLAECQDQALVTALEQGDHTPVSDPAEREMLDYATALTRAPAAMEEAAVQRLRDTGWSDRAILAIAEVTSYFNFVNRMADGLGVELERPREG